MHHPAMHSCTDLSVYDYLLNTPLIATLLLPSYKLSFFHLSLVLLRSFHPFPFCGLWVYSDHLKCFHLCFG